jgi:hypothetical protein
MKISLVRLVPLHLFPANFQTVFTTECVQQYYTRRVAVPLLTFAFRT